MAINPEYPFVESYYSGETEEHVRLKNIAAAWLLERGFSPEQIEDEYTVRSGSTYGRTDLYADDGSTEVFVECEHGQVSISRGGSVPAWDGKQVYVFTDEGIHLVEIVEQTAEPSPLLPSTETISREVLELEYWKELPTFDWS